MAAGIGHIAHGTDIGGSIRYPAYACGVHGLRPSLGRIPAWNSSSPERGIGPQLMAVSGPLARTVADLRTGLLAMMPGDARDPWWIPVPFDGPPAPKRVALCLRPDGMTIAPEVEAALLDAASRLRAAGYAVEEVDTTPGFREPTQLQLQLWLGDGWPGFRAAVEREGDPGALAVMHGVRAMAEALPPDIIATTLVRRNTLTRAWTRFLADTPLLLVPVSGELPFEDNLDRRSADDWTRVPRRPAHPDRPAADGPARPGRQHRPGRHRSRRRPADRRPVPRGPAAGGRRRHRGRRHAPHARRRRLTPEYLPSLGQGGAGGGFEALRMILPERLAMTLVFVANGTAFGAWAGNIPRLRERAGLDEASLGIVLLCISLGAVAAMPVAGRHAARIGLVRACWIGALALGTVLPWPALAPGWLPLLGSALVLGFFMGWLDVCMNAHGSGMERRRGAPIMSSLHAGWSLGQLAGRRPHGPPSPHPAPACWSPSRSAASWWAPPASPPSA